MLNILSKYSNMDAKLHHNWLDGVWVIELQSEIKIRGWHYSDLISGGYSYADLYVFNGGILISVHQDEILDSYVGLDSLVIGNDIFFWWMIMSNLTELRLLRTIFGGPSVQRLE